MLLQILDQFVICSYFDYYVYEILISIDFFLDEKVAKNQDLPACTRRQVLRFTAPSAAPSAHL